MSLFSREVCPFCFHRYRLRQTPFRCTSPAQLCRPEVDTLRAQKWGDTAPRGRVLPGKRSRRGRVQCPQCNEISQKRLCPTCHMELPDTTGQFRNLIFAVIGGVNAGKSHYLAVLIQRLKAVGCMFDMLLEPLDDATIKRYYDEFYQPLYEDHKTIDKTSSGLGQENAVRFPLVYTLTFRGTSLLGRRCIRSAVTLVFFDTAGEDLNTEDRMATVNKYIYEADGLILLLDPLQLTEVRSRLDGRVHLPDSPIDAYDIVARLSKLIRRTNDLGSNMIEKPLAVAFSKFDAVKSLVDPQLQLNARPEHDAGYDIGDFEAVHGEMQTLLEDWDRRLHEQVMTHYRHFGYFGLTALGCDPGATKRVPRVNPKRVEEPFLWLLHQHGLIRAAKRG